MSYYLYHVHLHDCCIISVEVSFKFNMSRCILILCIVYNPAIYNVLYISILQKLYLSVYEQLTGKRQDWVVKVLSCVYV